MENESSLILTKLASVGIKVNDIYDLVNSAEPYPEAIPVLIDLLNNNKLKNDVIKEGVIRSLAIKEAKNIANKVLLREYKNIPNSKILLKWAIGNTMSVIATEEDIDDIVSIVSDKNNGMSRQMFVIALGKFSTLKVEDALINLVFDEEVTLQTMKSLVKIKSQRSKSEIVKLLNHPNKVVQRAAENAIKALK